MSIPPYRLDRFTWRRDLNEPPYHTIKLSADLLETERVVPPAGESYAFDRDTYRHNVEISVSPTGRSVQVYVNGRKVYP